MHRKGWATGVVVLTILLSSCGSAEPETSETATSAPTTAAEIDAAEFVAAISSAQREARTYQMEITTESEGLGKIDASGAARYPDSGQVLDMSMTINLPEVGGEMEMVVIDGGAYLRLPPEAGLPLPTPWLKIDPDGGDPISAQMAPLIEQMTSSALEQSMETVAAASSIEQGDADVIDGVDVTEYVVTVDVSEMPADELGGVAPEDLPFDELTYSLWVDRDDLVRRMTSDLGGYGTMDTTIFGWGEPVEIEAPPADQVTDASTLQ